MMLNAEETRKLEAFLAEALGVADLRIDAASRIHGGASRETYSLDVIAAGKKQGFILRRDPVDSLIDTERTLEFAAYRSFADHTIPVPQAIALVTDASVLGQPFFVMQRIDGGAAESPFRPNPYGEYAAQIGAQFFSHLGAIAAVDPMHTELAKVVDIPRPEQCWQRELDYWEGVIDADSLEPQPIAKAAIRKLRRNPPPPPERLAVVHGDYRSGNFMHDGQGHILALLDWEMAHIGDPLEDLAWALDPLWSHGTELAAGMLARNEAIAIWQEASGRRFSQKAFTWWELFASVKGLAIWTSSSRAFVEGKNTDPVLSFSGWYCTVRHNQIIAERLSA